MAANAAGSLCKFVDDEIRLHAAATLGRRHPAARAVALATLSELPIAFPSWIGGLAGDANKLAAAHRVHNGLATLQRSKASARGELMDFGIADYETLQGAVPRDIVGFMCCGGSVPPRASRPQAARLTSVPARRNSGFTTSS